MIVTKNIICFEKFNELNILYYLWKVQALNPIGTPSFLYSPVQNCLSNKTIKYYKHSKLFLKMSQIPYFLFSNLVKLGTCLFTLNEMWAPFLAITLINLCEFIEILWREPSWLVWCQIHTLFIYQGISFPFLCLACTYLYISNLFVSILCK